MNTSAHGIFDPKYRRNISAAMQKLLTEKETEFKDVNRWGSDVHDTLTALVLNGKMIRGSLVLFIYEATTGKLSEDAIRVAVAIELFHSSLLIHDDIMDRDTKRRGKLTIHASYQAVGEQEKVSHPLHFGESMGMCVGDIGFFLGFQLLSTIENERIKPIIELCSKELMSTALSQMQDVYAGCSRNTISVEEIEKVYVYKTGRYTFSLPMMMGALLAHTDEQTIQNLEKLGEYVGLLFQVKDDELNLFGKEKDTGKPVGSDIRENKKTLHRFYLFEKASDMQKKTLSTIFRKGKITPAQVHYVQELITRLGVKTLIRRRMKLVRSKAEELIETLPVDDQYTDQLLKMLTYISERSS